MLTLTVTLLAGRYDAATDDRTVPEWPPHPARAFCALVAGAKSDAEWAALRWLEAQPPPNVLAASDVTERERSGYVVTNKREANGGSQFHPDRSSAFRSRVSTHPAADTVVFEWPDAQPDPETFADLDGLALRMPYLGRATAHVFAEFGHHAANGDTVDKAALSRFTPCRLAEATARLRVPYVGYVAALQEAFANGVPARSADRSVAYRDGDAREPRAVHQSRYPDLVILEFEGFQPDGSLAPRFTAALRRAVLDRVVDPAPAALHGHDLPDSPHVAFLALPQVGHQHSSGRLSGLAVALPSLTAPERAKIGGAVVGSWDLNVPGIGAVAVRYASAARLQSLKPGYWQARSRLWVSVTPVAYDRYPKSEQAWYDEIRRSCVLAGYPEPAAVELSTKGLCPGAAQIAKGELPKWLTHRVLRHVRLQFAERVEGPVMIGAGRNLGVGLFAPQPDAPEAIGILTAEEAT